MPFGRSNFHVPEEPSNQAWHPDGGHNGAHSQQPGNWLTLVNVVRPVQLILPRGGGGNT